MTGPLLLQNTDGTGLVYGKHTYKQAGEHTLEFCARIVLRGGWHQSAYI